MLYEVITLYGSYDFGDNRLTAGRSIRFWGALEAHNIVDGFNTVDLRNSPFDRDKIGAWNAALTHYTDTGSAALIVKFDEADQPMAVEPYARITSYNVCYTKLLRHRRRLCNGRRGPV